MKRSLWIVAFLVVVGAFAGFQQYHSWSLNKSDSAAKVEETSERSGRGQGQGRAGGGSQAQGRGGRARGGEVVPVMVATAVQKTIPVQLRAVGNVEPYSTVSVKSQVTGVLQQAHFKEGQDVKKGQLLFTIDPRPLEAALKQAEAALARDAAQLRNSREQVKRYAELVDKQYVSREQYDQIKTNADAAEAIVEADRAAVENARVQLSYCYIYSPIEGRVGSLLVNEGNLVRVNDGTPLVVINQVNPINVTFAVPEVNLADLRRHMAKGTLQVSANFPSDEGTPESGKLEFVDNAVDRSTGTVKLKGVFANTQRRLWPGQYVNVALTLTTQSGAIVVPAEAVQVGQEGQHVFVVKEDRRVEVRPVTIERTTEGEAIIAKGLAAGEQVVREGQFLLGSGSRIEVKDPTRVDAGAAGEGRKSRSGRGKAGGEADAAASKPQAAEAEVGQGSKTGAEQKGEGRRRRGEGKSKSEAEARGGAEKRGDS